MDFAPFTDEPEIVASYDFLASQMQSEILQHVAAGRAFPGEMRYRFVLLSALMLRRVLPVKLFLSGQILAMAGIVIQDGISLSPEWEEWREEAVIWLLRSGPVTLESEFADVIARLTADGWLQFTRAAVGSVTAKHCGCRACRAGRRGGRWH